MNATGLPPWFSIAKIATSEASHSTANEQLSCMEWRAAFSSSLLRGCRQLLQLCPMEMMLHSSEVVSGQRIEGSI